MIAWDPSGASALRMTPRGKTPRGVNYSVFWHLRDCHREEAESRRGDLHANASRNDIHRLDFFLEISVGFILVQKYERLPKEITWGKAQYLFIFLHRVRQSEHDLFQILYS